MRFTIDHFNINVLDLENFEDEMAVEGKKSAIFYRREGNLFLHDEKSEPAAQKAYS